MITITARTNSLNAATTSQTFTLIALGISCLDSTKPLNVKRGATRADTIYTVGSTEFLAAISPFDEIKND